jgi:hypothetical protein
MTLLLTVLYIAFSLFCLKKGDDWGAGAFGLWAGVSFFIASLFGSIT